MLEEYKNFDVKIKGKLYEFSLDIDQEGAYLSILDSGGLTDAFPKHYEQYDWIKPKLARITGIEQIWATQWHIKTKSALKKVVELLEKHSLKID